MSKRRSCRRTIDENIIHEKAVKLRKMTDEQLVHYVEERAEKARSEGFNQGSRQKLEILQTNLVEFVEEISQMKGIGAVTKNKLKNLLDKRLVGDVDA